MNNRISLFVSSSSNEWLYNGDILFIIGYINYISQFSKNQQQTQKRLNKK